MGMGSHGSHRIHMGSNGNKISHGNWNGMGMGIRRVNGKKSPHSVTIASGAIHGISWAVNGSQSCESCIQLLAKSCVQLPAREYLALLVDYWRSAEQTCRREQCEQSSVLT